MGFRLPAYHKVSKSWMYPGPRPVLKDGLYLDIRAVVNNSRVEQGLLGLGFHPKYAPPLGPTRDSTESWVIGHCRKRSFNCLTALRLLFALVSAEAEELPHAAEETSLFLVGFIRLDVGIVRLAIGLCGALAAARSAPFPRGASFGLLDVIRPGASIARFHLARAV
jgi:hypothetical protein